MSIAPELVNCTCLRSEQFFNKLDKNVLKNVLKLRRWRRHFIDSRRLSLEKKSITLEFSTLSKSISTFTSFSLKWKRNISMIKKKWLFWERSWRTNAEESEPYLVKSINVIIVSQAKLIRFERSCNSSRNFSISSLDVWILFRIDSKVNIFFGSEFTLSSSFLSSQLQWIASSFTFGNITNSLSKM